MIFEGLPLNQKDVFIRGFEAAQQLMRDVARHRRDDGLRLGKGALEVCTFTRPDVEDGYFKNHLTFPSVAVNRASDSVRLSASKSVVGSLPLLIRGGSDGCTLINFLAVIR